MINQKVIPAISSVKNFEKFLKTDLEYCAIVNMHISLMKDLVKQAHQENKKCIVHLDLLKGVSKDESGVEYLVQFMKVDGIISTKPLALRTAKKLRVISIQRIFLIDSYSLEKSIELISKTNPDYIEMLPALAYKGIDKIKEYTTIPVIAGGLISTQEDIDHCIERGALAVTTSEKLFWE